MKVKMETEITTEIKPNQDDIEIRVRDNPIRTHLATFISHI